MMVCSRCTSSSSQVIASGFMLLCMLAAEELKGQVQTRNIFDIRLGRQYNMLRDVTVDARKQRIEVSDSKLVLNVQNSALSQGKSALEILTQMPGVSLGQDDEILLKGSTGVNVMVDGRMTYLSGKQLSTFLLGLNADNIAKK